MAKRQSFQSPRRNVSVGFEIPPRMHGNPFSFGRGILGTLQLLWFIHPWNQEAPAVTAVKIRTATIRLKSLLFANSFADSRSGNLAIFEGFLGFLFCAPRASFSPPSPAPHPWEGCWDSVEVERGYDQVDYYRSEFRIPHAQRIMEIENDTRIPRRPRSSGAIREDGNEGFPRTQV